MSEQMSEQMRKSLFNTTIRTKVDSNRSISSIYRKYENQFFESYGWETFLWDGGRIAGEYDVMKDANQVINLHLEITNSLKEGTG